MRRALMVPDAQSFDSLWVLTKLPIPDRTTDEKIRRVFLNT